MELGVTALSSKYPGGIIHCIAHFEIFHRWTNRYHIAGNIMANNSR